MAEFVLLTCSPSTLPPSSVPTTSNMTDSKFAQGIAELAIQGYSVATTLFTLTIIETST